ncbi:hypothetical protein [Lysinibacillus boronitolerans]|uniref:hypothetical protein n=1 Tax=Lysinibacillus boronitolerans TaxID=309788 RepID=UPI0038621C02
MPEYFQTKAYSHLIVLGIDELTNLEVPSVIIEKVEIYKEFPIHLKLNNQKAFGLIDYLIELPNGWVIIDHKTFPGHEDLWGDRAVSHLPQLQIYAHALEVASKKPVLEAWIHMPIVGKMVQFNQSDLVLSDGIVYSMS